MEQIYAPFNEEQVKNININQDTHFIHPYTCCNHINMIAKEDGLHCSKCERIQTWVWGISTLDIAKEMPELWNKVKDIRNYVETKNIIKNHGLDKG